MNIAPLKADRVSGRLIRVPAYWLALIGFRVLFHLLSWTTLRVNHFYGACVGRLLYWIDTDLKHISRVNLEIAYADLSEAEREQLLKESLVELGKTITELGHVWTGSERRIRGLIVDIQGQEYLDEALASGRGVIAMSPHLGSWELMGLYLSLEYGITSLYRPPRLRAAERFARQVRERFGADLVPTDVSGVRSLRRALAQESMIGILPDQDPGDSGGMYAPFFGRPVRTMQLASRLAVKTGCPLIFAVAERLPRGRGFRIHFIPADPLVASDNETVATAALNQEVESVIRMSPAQYLWAYKRFKNPPAGESAPYCQSLRRAA